MYHSSVALLHSTTFALIAYSSLAQALPSNGKGRVYARDSGDDYDSPMLPTGTALSASAASTASTSSASRSFPMAAVLGVIIGGVVLTFTLIGLITWYCRRKGSGKRNTLVLKVDEPTAAEIARETMVRKPTTSTTSSTSSGRGVSSQGTLHTINVVSPISMRSPPARSPPAAPAQHSRRSTDPRRLTYTPYSQTAPPFRPPTILSTSPPEEDEGRSYISRPITLLPPVPSVLPPGRPQMQMNQVNGQGANAGRHYLLQSSTVGRQTQQPGYAPRPTHNRRETLRDETVLSAFGLTAQPEVAKPFPSLVKA